jgi:hypothetical protein
VKLIPIGSMSHSVQNATGSFSRFKPRIINRNRQEGDGSLESCRRCNCCGPRDISMTRSSFEFGSEAPRIPNSLIFAARLSLVRLAARGAEERQAFR